MFGRFLEISVATGDIAASVQFYERLGFTQLTTGDTWSHPYGVLSDGRLCLGLHQRAAPSPVLSFVQPDLARHVPALRNAGFDPYALRLGENDFHAVQLRSPGGQEVALLEARTFSPPRTRSAESVCGWFSAYGMPESDTAAAQAFWERAGFIALDESDEAPAHLPLTSDHLNLSLYRPRALPAPALVFVDPGMEQRLARLADLGIARAPDLPRGLDPRHNALIEAPEGTLLLLLSAAP